MTTPSPPSPSPSVASHVDVMVHVLGRSKDRSSFGVGRFDVHHEDGRVLALAPAEGLHAGKGFREDKQLGADECWLDAEGADDEDYEAFRHLERVYHRQPVPLHWKLQLADELTMSFRLVAISAIRAVRPSPRDGPCRC